jgi:hypothetical protein
LPTTYNAGDVVVKVEVVGLAPANLSSIQEPGMLLPIIMKLGPDVFLQTKSFVSCFGGKKANPGANPTIFKIYNYNASFVVGHV